MSIDYDTLLQRMLDKVSNDVEKREGSLIFDALGPCAYALAEQDFERENFIDLVLPDTAVGVYLDRAVWPFVTRQMATASQRVMVTTMGEAAIGSRWGIDGLVYTVTEKLEENRYRAECETTGVIGNLCTGAVQPLSAVSGVLAELTDVLVPGTETEKDESLRGRFYQKVQRPITSGNIYHYRAWALEVPGVGDAKAIPLESGRGTVTVLVLDDDRNVDTSLEPVVAEYIEELRPIGAKVTVTSPTTIPINVTVDVVLDESETLGNIRTAFRAELDAYLKGVVRDNYALPRKQVADDYRVSLARVGRLLLSQTGINDYDNLTLNGAGNVTIGPKEVPVVGTVELSEVREIGPD